MVRLAVDCLGCPTFGERLYPLAEASKHLTGVALELTPSVYFVPKNERARLPLASFWARTRGTVPALLLSLIRSDLQVGKQRMTLITLRARSALRRAIPSQDLGRTGEAERNDAYSTAQFTARDRTTLE
jgi:hypothetical protein